MYTCSDARQEGGEVLPLLPTACAAYFHGAQRQALQAVHVELDASASQPGSSSDGELTGTVDAEIYIVQAQPVAIVGVGDIDMKFL